MIFQKNIHTVLLIQLKKNVDNVEEQNWKLLGTY